ncbi:DNA polymerase IV [Halorubrum californiense DSM 19288]|uniref:DNA polymerase IV n=1 Tax=Halorubrum californiense DSM 19288 TaxID=1227465 RepID=M0EGM2_9EURY|nr:MULTISPECIES: DNA polymerase IV [Halorubrum]ELZ46915.1 DNA polymerase IV [Halorubrum californiense DSM 19288]TKX69983.1 DNA polymerase IV [Halorubrum sp. GN11GM_10-3_MGM]
MTGGTPAAGETLPGAGDGDDDAPESVVCHVDMDCFYASCERLRHGDLAGEPVVVGMGYEPGESIGAVATASYEAREFGVESAMPISKALELLPRRADADPDDPDAPDSEATGRYLPVDLDFYEDVANEVKDVLRDCADTRREVSIDEAYLDVTDRTAWTVAGGGGGTGGDTGPGDPPPSGAAGPAEARTLAEGYARHVKDRIEREAGVPASVGVAPNMSAAKVASDADKPDGLVVVPPGSVADFLAPLPTADVHGVGPVTEETLAELGIETAGDLAAADRDRLAEALGERGPELSRRAAGDDDREVTPTGLPKSLSRESALPTTADESTKRETVSALAADVARRARERGCLYRTIGIKAVEPPFDVNTRARSLPGPVDDPDLVEEVALDLLGEFDDARVRKLGVRVSKLDFAESDQATLGGFEAGDGAERDGDGHDGAADRPRGSDARATATDGDGGKLTDWMDGEPTAEAAEGDAAGGDAERRTGDGQASLGDWS